MRKYSMFWCGTISKYTLKCKKQGTEQCIYLLYKEGDKSENMFDLFGKDAQEAHKNIYRVDRDRIERELLYYVPFLCCLDFWTK